MLASHDSWLSHLPADNPHGNPHPVESISRKPYYDEGKRCAETLFFDYWRQHGLPIKVARIFNTYGPRMRPDDGRVVSNFITQALRGESLTIHGDGSQTRSFCYVDDLIDGLIRMMATPPAATGPVNLGNPFEISMRDLAALIIDLCGASAPIETRPLPSDDPRQRQPDISEAMRTLDWAPSTGLREGLLKTIKYFDRLLSAGRADIRSASPS